MKRFFAVFMMLWVLCDLSAFAKDDAGFTFEKKSKFKPQNQKVLTQSWTRGLKAGNPSKRYSPETSSPTQDGGMIYVGTHGGYFYAVNASDGKIVWNYENGEPISSTAAVTPDRVFFSDLGGHLICLNKSDGTEIWKRFFSQEILGQPLAQGNNLYVLKGEQEILAVSQADGHVVWNRFISTFVKKMTMRGQSTIVADDGSLYAGLADGHLYRLSAGDGRILWEKNLSVPYRSFKDIDAKVVIDGDSLYIGGYFGAFYRLRKSTGEVVWSSDVATGVQAKVLADVVVVSDIDGTVVGLNKMNGKQIWSNELNNSVLSAPVAFNDKIFVSTLKQNAYLLDPATGNQVQKLGMAPGSINEPVADGHQIYVLTSSSKLVALKSR